MPRTQSAVERKPTARDIVAALTADPSRTLDEVREGLGVSKSQLRTWRRDPAMPWFDQTLKELGKTSRGGPGADAKRAVSVAAVWGIADHDFHVFVQTFARTKSWAEAERESGISRAAVRARCDPGDPLFDQDVAELVRAAEQGHLADAEDKLWEAASNGDPRVLQFILTSRNPERWDQGGRMRLARQKQEQRQKEVLTSEAAVALARTALESVIAGIREKELRDVTPIEVKAR